MWIKELAQVHFTSILYSAAAHHTTAESWVCQLASKNCEKNIWNNISNENQTKAKNKREWIFQARHFTLLMGEKKKQVITVSDVWVLFSDGSNIPYEVLISRICKNITHKKKKFSSTRSPSWVWVCRPLSCYLLQTNPILQPLFGFPFSIPLLLNRWLNHTRISFKEKQQGWRKAKRKCLVDFSCFFVRPSSSFLYFLHNIYNSLDEILCSAEIKSFFFWLYIKFKHWRSRRESLGLFTSFCYVKGKEAKRFEKLGKRLTKLSGESESKNGNKLLNKLFEFLQANTYTHTAQWS